MTTVLVIVGPEPRVLARHDERRRSAGTLGELGSDLAVELGRIDDIRVDLRRTDDEAEVTAWLHEAIDRRWGVVLDPAAFTHYSYALRDAAALVTEAGLPLIEVHPVKPLQRDESGATVVSGVSTGVITGLGLDSYLFGVQAAARFVAPVGF